MVEATTGSKQPGSGVNIGSGWVSRAQQQRSGRKTNQLIEQKKALHVSRARASHWYHGKQESVHFRQQIWQESVQDFSGCLGSDSPAAGAIPVPVGCWSRLR